MRHMCEQKCLLLFPEALLEGVRGMEPEIVHFGGSVGGWV